MYFVIVESYISGLTIFASIARGTQRPRARTSASTKMNCVGGKLSELDLKVTLPGSLMQMLPKANSSKLLS